jgi:hypothetical protein
MGILETLPSGLIELLTWSVLMAAASAVILILSVALGKVLGEFIDGVIGNFR